MKPAPKNNWLNPLLRWLSGDATRQDEQALDALAQKDPFLAEAMEGYRSLPKGNHAAAVTKLKAELRRKYEKRRRGAVFYLVRVAAMGLVMLAAWFVFRQTNETGRSNAEVAQVQTEEPPTQSEAAAANEMAAAGTSHESAPQPVQHETERGELLRKETTEKRVQQKPSEEIAAITSAAKALSKQEEKQFTLVSPPVEAKDSVMTADDAIATKSVTKAASLASPLSAATEHSAVTLSKLDATKTAGPPRLVSGKVTDQNGDPLIGVDIRVAGTDKGTMTDMEGNFAIDASGASKLAFSYTGFHAQELQLSQDSFFEIRMQESHTLLDEITVTGFQARKKSKTENNDLPQPEGGFRKLEKHIEKNLKHPEPDVKKRLNGEVTLRFRVNPDGSISDFQVEKSLSAGYNEEAKRLLLEGPKWKPAGTAVYTIKF